MKYVNLMLISDKIIHSKKHLWSYRRKHAGLLTGPINTPEQIHVQYTSLNEEISADSKTSN